MHADRTNRIILLLLAVLLIAAGLAAGAASIGVFGSATTHRPLIANAAGNFIGAQGVWLWPAAAGAAAILVLLALRWLLALLFSTDRSGDLLIHPGGPAGRTTLAAGALTEAVAEDLVRVRRYRRGALLMGGTQAFRSLSLWLRYLDVAYPAKPADWAGYIAALRARLTEPGRMAEFMKTLKTTPADAEAQLPNVRCPALIVMGTEDPDFPDPRAEGEAIAAALPAGLGTLATVDGGGHYPHAQCPDEITALVTGFLSERVRA
jgi:pimeloyl-ACP methyl ester carboxylesterase